MNKRRIRDGLYGFMLAGFLCLLALMLASACQPAEQARQAEPAEPTMELQVLVNDNFIDVMDDQVIGHVKLHHFVSKSRVHRITDMDACLVFYVVGDLATSVHPVTESMTNSFGKLEHCNR